jgi:hypothetical protein
LSFLLWCWDQTQGLTHARQALYCTTEPHPRNKVPALFCKKVDQEYQSQSIKAPRMVKSLLGTKCLKCLLNFGPKAKRTQRGKISTFASECHQDKRSLLMREDRKQMELKLQSSLASLSCLPSNKLLTYPGDTETEAEVT